MSQIHAKLLILLMVAYGGADRHRIARLGKSKEQLQIVNISMT